MPTTAARPYLVFLFLMGIVVAAESAALASRAMLIRPDLVRGAESCSPASPRRFPSTFSSGGGDRLRPRSASSSTYTALWLIGDLRALVLRPIRIEGALLLQVDGPDALAAVLRPTVSATA